MNYFNEINPVACAVLREVHPKGVVDARDIRDIGSSDLRGYERLHFFAGAGLWELACRLADWTGPIWTASCPCQPFSVAGKGGGVSDSRHLWPDLFRLVDRRRPRIVVGEQVSSKLGKGWFHGVRSDLAGIGYACSAVDIPACAVNAPHRRNRLYWVAVADAGSRGFRDDGRSELAGAAREVRGEIRQQRLRPDVRAVHDSALADAGSRRHGSDDAQSDQWSVSGCVREVPADDLGDTNGSGWSRTRLSNVEGQGDFVPSGPDGPEPHGADGAGFWSGVEWIVGGDGKTRRSKPGVRLLVDGMAGRVDLWRLAGNSIVPQVAAEVLKALKETLACSAI